MKSIQDIMRQDAGIDGDAQRISQLAWLFFLKIFDDKEHERQARYELEGQAYETPIPTRLRWQSWAADPEGITGDTLLEFVNNDLFPTLQNLDVSDGNERSFVIREAFSDAYNYMKSGTLLRQVVNKINEINFNRRQDQHLFGDIYEKILRDLQSAGNAGEFYTPRAITHFMVEMIDPRLGEVVLDPACGTGGFLTHTIDHLARKYVRNASDWDVLQRSVRGIEKKQLPHLLAITNLMLHGIDVPEHVRHDNTLSRPYASYGPSDQVDVIVTNPPFGGTEEPGIESNFPAVFRTRETADMFLVLIERLLKPNGRAAVVLPDGFLFGTDVKARIKEHLLRECNVHTIVRLPANVFSPYATVKTNLVFFDKPGPTDRIWFYEHPLPSGYKSYSKTKPIRSEEFDELRHWWEDRSASSYAWSVSIDDLQRRGFNLDLTNPSKGSSAGHDTETLRAKYFACLDRISELRSRLKDYVKSKAASTYHSALETVIDLAPMVPSGTNNLRILAAHLAVAGRLRFESGQEPSTVEQTRRVPWTVPDGWRWRTLSDIADFRIGKTPRTSNPGYWCDSDSSPEEGTAWMSIADMRHFGRVSVTSRRVTDVARREVFGYEPIPAGTLLMSFKLTIGKVTISDVDTYHNEAIASIRPGELVTRDYLFYVLPLLAQLGKSNPAIMGRTLNKTTLRQLPVPVPPLDAQAEIVASLERIHGLLGQIEAESELLSDCTNLLFQSATGDLLSPRGTQSAPTEGAHQKVPN